MRKMQANSHNNTKESGHRRLLNAWKTRRKNPEDHLNKLPLILTFEQRSDYAKRGHETKRARGYTRKGIMKSCKFCHNDFYTKPCEIMKRFCSTECAKLANNRTKWINNGETSKRINTDEIIPKGWEIGRTPFNNRQKNFRWITDGIKNYKLRKDEPLPLNWTYGMTKKTQQLPDDLRSDSLEVAQAISSSEHLHPKSPQQDYIDVSHDQLEDEFDEVPFPHRNAPTRIL